MSMYTDSECISCGKAFTENDDVVVCPECGTPYHRQCYLKEGRCINEKLHISHGSWISENKPIDNDVNEEKVYSVWTCEDCGAENSSKYIRCQECGSYDTDTLMELLEKNEEKITTATITAIEGECCGFNPDSEIQDGVTVAEMNDFIGVNQNFYLPLFKNMKKKKRSVSMNIWGFAFPHYFFASRKMYLESGIVLLLWTLFSLPSEFIYMYDSGIIFNSVVSAIVESSYFMPLCKVCMVLAAILRISMFLFSNKLYYNHCIRKIKNIKLKFKPPQTELKIRQRGGTSFIPAVCVAAVQVFIASVLSLFMFLGDFL